MRDGALSRQRERVDARPHLDEGEVACEVASFRAAYRTSCRLLQRVPMSLGGLGESRQPWWGLELQPPSGVPPVMCRSYPTPVARDVGLTASGVRTLAQARDSTLERLGHVDQRVVDLNGSAS
jgi:hypothetical protein